MAAVVQTTDVVRQGMVLQQTSKGVWRPIRVQLSRSGDLVLQLQQHTAPSASPVRKAPPLPSPNEIRTVRISKENSPAGIGLSIKGGADYQLPVLISRILPGTPAERCRQLFVGDAILKINDQPVSMMQHDDVVGLLREVKNELTLTVRHVAPVSHLLTNADNLSASSCADVGNNLNTMVAPENETLITERSARPREPSVSPTTGRRVREKVFLDVLRFNLAFAYIHTHQFPTGLIPARDAQYQPSAVREVAVSFEVVSVDGESTGNLRCDDDHLTQEWTNCIHNSILLASNQVIQSLNNNLTEQDGRIVFMSWLLELDSQRYGPAGAALDSQAPAVAMPPVASPGRLSTASPHAPASARARSPSPSPHARDRSTSRAMRDDRQSIVSTGSNISSAKTPQSSSTGQWAPTPVATTTAPNAASVHHSVSTCNGLAVPAVCVNHASCDQAGYGRSSSVATPWKRLAICLKGEHVLLFRRPPLFPQQLQHYLKQYPIVECILKVFRARSDGDKPSSADGVDTVSTASSGSDCDVIMQTSSGDYYSWRLDTRLLGTQLEKAWYGENLQAVRRMRRASYPVTCDGQVCQFVLDVEQGLSLLQAASPSLAPTGAPTSWRAAAAAPVWRFAFSQLRASTDDGVEQLILQFEQRHRLLQPGELDRHDDASLRNGHDPSAPLALTLSSRRPSTVVRSVTTVTLQCSQLVQLLFHMHAFMAAKLAIVDPYFLRLC